MIVRHNIAALKVQRNLNENSQGVAKSSEKLASGLRINRAADEAAGLAISEKMRAQIRGLEQAEKNANDGKSLMQTAEGGLNEIHSSLQRIRELAVQAANDTNSSEDRKMIQEEISQLKEGIDDIANQTQFNTIPLLNRTNSSGTTEGIGVIDGSEKQLTSDANYDTQPSWSKEKIAFNRGADLYIMEADGSNISLFKNQASQAALSKDGTKLAYVQSDMNLYMSNVDGTGEVQLTTSGGVEYDNTFGSSLSWNADESEVYFKTANGIEKVDVGDASNRTIVIADAGSSSPSLSPDGTQLAFEKDGAIFLANADGTGIAKLTDSGTGPAFSPDGSKIAFSAYSIETNDNEIFVINKDGTGLSNLTGPMSTASSHNHNIFPSWSPDGKYIVFHSDNVDNPSTSGDIWSVEVTSGANAGSSVKGTDIRLQIGANAGDIFHVTLTDARSAALGLDGIKVDPWEEAAKSIGKLDVAIQQVSSERAKFGAYQNSLEHITNNLVNYTLNLTAAESRIRDTDMAKEVMNQAKASILSEASQAILAQANQMPQQILQLLK